MSWRRERLRPLIIAIVIGVLLAASLLPTTYMASPRWEVWVVAEDGKPLPGINVRLVYKNYSAEDKDHEVTLITDQNGHVLFPAQFQKASLVRRVLYTLWSARGGVHSSFGRHAYVLAFGKSYQGSATSGKYVTDWRGSPPSMESRIVATSR